MVDNFSSYIPQLNDPAGRLFTITPDDSNDLAEFTRGLMLPADGTIVVVMALDDTDTAITLTGLAGGVLHPLRVKKVLSTGTDSFTGDILGAV